MPLTLTDQKAQSMPVVFMFPAEQYKVVPNEQMDDWEKLMMDRIGMKPESKISATPTVSFCGSGTDIADACDCDQI